MKHLLITLIFLIVIKIGNTQELIPFRIDNKWGYSNTEAKIIIPIIYDEASEFNSVEQANVTKNKRSYCIDKLGKSVKCVDKKGICVGVGINRHKQLITYKKNGKIGIVVKRIRDSIINLNEIYLLDSLPALWDKFHHNYKTVAVKLGDSWGIIDIKGKLLVDIKYDNIEIQNSMFIIKKDDKFGFINDIGRIVTEPIYNRIEFSYANDYAKVWTAENKVGYVSKNGLEYFEDK